MTQQTTTQTSPAPDEMPPPYTVWRVETSVFDAWMNLVDEFVDTQELWIEPPNIVVRRTRELEGTGNVTYEDRGTLGETLQITGTDGFGGEWTGQLLPGGIAYTQGRGGAADFNLVNTPVEEGVGICVRTIDVHRPIPWLTPMELSPGRYYVTTVDRLVRASEDVPESMRQPLPR